MPRDGGGDFSLLYDFVQDKTNGVSFSAERMQAQLEDIADAIDTTVSSTALTTAIDTVDATVASLSTTVSGLSTTVSGMSSAVTAATTFRGLFFIPRDTTYGAVGNGTTNDRAAFAAADTAAAAAGGTILVTQGTYAIASNITISSPIVFMPGAKLKPANGVTVTLNGYLEAPVSQVFDLSAGGLVTGSAKTRNATVYPEWWGAVANGITDVTSPILAAVAFLKQRTSASVTGGVLQFSHGAYVISAAIHIDFSGLVIRGVNQRQSYISYPDGIQAIYIEGDTAAAGKASYGTLIENLTIQTSATQPTSSIGIYCEFLQSCVIQNVEFNGFWQAVVMHHCAGPYAKRIHRCLFSAVNVSPAATNAACIVLEGGAVHAYDFNENVTISECHGGGGGGGFIGIQYGIIVSAVDVLHLTANHFFGAEEAMLLIDNSAGRYIWNIHSTANQWEPLTTGAKFGIKIVGGTGVYCKAMFFVGEQIINGSTAGIGIYGDDPRDIIFTNFQVQACKGDSVLVVGGTNIKFDGGTLEDCDADGSGSNAHIRLGTSSTTPTAISLMNIAMRQPIIGNAAQYGIYIDKGADVQISACRIRDASTPFAIGASGITDYYLDDLDVGVEDVTTITGSITIPNYSTTPHYHITSGAGTITLNNAGGYAADFDRTFKNGTSRRWTITDGTTSIYVFPGQTARVQRLGSAWSFQAPELWLWSAATTVYVNHASGSSGNDGLSSGSAFATIQQAIDFLEKWVDCGQNGPTIQVAAGTFTEVGAVFTKRLRGYHVVYLVGDHNTPSNCVWQVTAGNTGLTARDWSGVIVDGFKFVSTGTGSTGVSCSQHGVIDFWNNEWGLFDTGTHINSTNGGSIGYVAGATEVVSGDHAIHWDVSAARMIATGFTVSVPSALTFTTWLSVGLGGTAIHSGVSFTGAGAGGGSTGAKYSVSMNGAYYKGGVTLPGATAGATSTGGQAA